MAAIDNTMISNILNATLPCGTTAKPAVFTALSSAAGMKLKLTSTASTASASGTELTGSGYTAGGTALTNSSSASSAGSAVTLPATAAVSWTNASGGNWVINSLEITDNAGVRAWYGLFNGAPITVANGNTFQIAVNAVTVSLS